MLALLLALAAALAATVHVVEVRGSIDPGTAAHVVEAVRAAEAEGAAALVVELDTPGGLVTSAREIVQAELSSRVPVVAHVSPSGARAGSAGVFVTLAAHVAAMAPGTTIGAAHPVGLFGGFGSGDDGAGDEDRAARDDREVMAEKVLNDVLAWARAIAEERGRDPTFAEAAVRESQAITAREALDRGVVDLLARDLPALLEALDGRQIRTAAGPVRLETRGATVVRREMSARHRVVHFLGDPNVLFVLLGLGLLGVYVEFHNPGLVLPGLLGAAALLAAGIGLSILPFRLGGLVLVLLGFASLALEAWVGGKGVFALVGGLCIAGGGALLFDVEGLDLRIDPGPLLGVAAASVAGALLVAWLVARAHRRPVATGAEGLVGARGRVLRAGRGGGWVEVAGERWRARWPGRLERGRTVAVRAVDGLVLEVDPRRVRAEGEE